MYWRLSWLTLIQWLIRRCYWDCFDVNVFWFCASLFTHLFSLLLSFVISISSMRLHPSILNQYIFLYFCFSLSWRILKKQQLPTNTCRYSLTNKSYLAVHILNCLCFVPFFYCDKIPDTMNRINKKLEKLEYFSKVPAGS